MKLLTSEEVAAFFSLSTDTIRRWRVQGIGPIYCKLGNRRCDSVRYTLEDVQSFAIRYKQKPRKTK